MPRKNPGAEARTSQGWNLDNIRELVDLLRERDVAEFEMEKNGLRIHIKRGSVLKESDALVQANNVRPAFPPSTPADPPPLVSPAPPASRSQEGSSAEAAGGESADGLHIIKSPIVGTFYSSPSPTAPPFVKPGDVVHVGQVLCIIEAMKLMNEIESEADGEVVRMYVENGQPVEYGQALFAIQPSLKK